MENNPGREGCVLSTTRCVEVRVEAQDSSGLYSGSRVEVFNYIYRLNLNQRNHRELPVIVININ
jgi:hypothetical protein